MRPRGTGVPGRTGLYRLAGALTVLVLGALATASALDVALASRLVAENVEWESREQTMREVEELKRTAGDKSAG